MILKSHHAGIYCIVFAGSVWVLVKRRRADNSQAISPVIDVCFWLIFITLTIVCSTLLFALRVLANANAVALRQQYILPLRGSSRSRVGSSDQRVLPDR
jgi:hypothetical protein